MDNDTIDWEAQWKEHAPGFRDGFLTLEGDHGSVRLRAGPGFGDLSHPTTRLVLERMRGVVKDRVFVDIGCGSGILSCCALMFGAKAAYGVDIDPQAVEHARKNAALNGMEHRFQCFLPGEFTGKEFIGKCVAAMNMIQCEQEVAWDSLPFLGTHVDTIITSGILEVDERKYLDLCQNRWGWTLMGKSVEGQWSSYTFQRKPVA